MTESDGSPRQPESRLKFTGKQLVMLDNRATHKAITTHASNASLKLAAFSDYKMPKDDFTKAFDEADGIVFEHFGVAVINKDREKQVTMLTESASSKNTFIYTERERYVYALVDDPFGILSGYQEAYDAIYRKVKGAGKGKSKPKTVNSGLFQDDDVASWGIHAINALTSKFTGAGVNLAILDTGFNLKHPDFVDRVVTSESFIRSQKVDDLNGHGSHCTGISTGDINKLSNRRYGVAKNANIFIGKVLSNAGSGTDSGILAGIEWAITNNCKIISMSLGAAVEPGEVYSNIYNDLAKKALAQGTIIIAAAGNESRRDLGIISPVGHPANCPSIMAVAALDNNLNIASFSCGGTDSDGGQVDIAAPGVNVYSSWTSPKNYNSISGTSMATPCVAGIAALFKEAYPTATAADIWSYLTQNAKPMSLNASDVGAGLVQAPQ